jgi:hypothetical protein
MRKRQPSGARLGASAETHKEQAKRHFNEASGLLNQVETAARRKDCPSVIQRLIAAQAHTSAGHAHLESFTDKRGDFSRRHLELQERNAQLQNTLGWQCTRKV